MAIPALRGILIARPSAFPAPLSLTMGAKYLPTVKDQKASLRFLKKQKPVPNFKYSSHALTEPVTAAPSPVAEPAPAATPAKTKTTKRK